MNVIEAAKAAGFRTGQINLTGCEPIPFAAAISATDCLHELERFAQIIRDQSLEDAAVCCDEESSRAATAWKSSYNPEYQGREIGADNCADAIRALKGAKE